MSDQARIGSAIGGRRLSRRAGLRVGALAGGGLAAFALACGGSGGKDSGGAQTTAPSGASTAAAAGQQAPRPGGIISQRLNTDPPSLDLHQVTTYTGVWPGAPTLNQLIQYDPAKPGDTPADIIADLAEKWEQPDPASLVFTLRKGVKFHDGSDFTGEDVKAQLDWIKAPPQGKTSPRAGRVATIDAIELPDPFTVRLKLSRPTPSLLGNMAGHYFGIGQAKDIVANGGIGPTMLGTGPFKFKSFQRSNTLELEKNPSYWKQGLPYLDGLKFFIQSDLATSLTNFIGGQYHLFYDTGFLPADADRVKADMGDKAEVERVNSYSRDIAFINARRPPYNDIRVRRAISLALDRDAGINVVREKAALRGAYMAPKGVWAIPEADLRKYDGYDKPNIEQAKQLLSAAGVTGTLDAAAITRTDFKNMAEFIKDQLAKIGINLKLTTADTATAQAQIQRSDFDIGPWTISIDTDDPDATFAEVSTSKAVRNWSGVTDAQIDALFDKQSQLADTNERKKVVQDLERQALSQYQFATLYFAISLHARARAVRNMVIHESLYTSRRMEAVWYQP